MTKEKSWKENLLLSMLLVAILIASCANAHALGVAPSRKVVDYTTEPIKLSGRVINNELKDMKVLLYPEGDFADAITLDETSMNIKSTEPEKEFTYTLKMPPNIDPGTKNLSIVIIEVPLSMDVKDTGQANIISTISVAHQIMVNVPYPGQYAEGYLLITNGNVNDTITFSGTILNRGTEKLSEISGDVVIKGPTNEELARLPTNTLASLDPQTSDKIAANWKANVNAGMYYAEFIVNYEENSLS